MGRMLERMLFFGPPCPFRACSKKCERDQGPEQDGGGARPRAQHYTVRMTGCVLSTSCMVQPRSCVTLPKSKRRGKCSCNCSGGSKAVGKWVLLSCLPGCVFEVIAGDDHGVLLLRVPLYS